MNQPAFKRYLGIYLIIMAVLGMILSVYGLFSVWRIKNDVEDSLTESFDLIQDALVVTVDALSTAQQSLEIIGENVTLLHDALITTAQSLNDSLPVMDAFASLTQEDFPETLEAARVSLEAAQVSAELVDTVMKAVTSIPFYPGEPYNPEVPLNLALRNVATSLEGLPESLIEMGDDLETNIENVTQLESEIINLAVTLAEIKSTVQEAQAVTTSYQEIISTTQTRISLLQSNTPQFLNKMGWALTVVLTWLTLTLGGLALQGLTLVGAGQVA